MTIRSLPFPITLTATLVSGAASLERADGTRDLVVGATIEVQEPATRPAASHVDLRREAGTWVLEVTETDPDTGEQRRLGGVETCREGPGGHWIESSMTVEVPGERVQVSTVLGFDRSRSVWHGSLVDSFGGQMALLHGTAEGDPRDRVLEMRRFDGQSFGARLRMIWVGDDERRTVLETQRDGKWQVVREIVHRRQPAEMPLFQVILNVRDMRRQVEFYRDVLGLSVVLPAGSADWSAEDFVRLTTAGSALALHRGRSSEVGRDEPRLSFRVDDLEAARARLRAAGIDVGEVRTPAPGVRVLDCRDPEGNAFHLEQHTGR